MVAIRTTFEAPLAGPEIAGTCSEELTQSQTVCGEIRESRGHITDTGAMELFLDSFHLGAQSCNRTDVGTGMGEALLDALDPP